MEDEHQYPVFFECHSPLVRGPRRRAIEQHFSLRRRSGGGDCGPLTTVRDDVFRVAFRSRAGLSRHAHMTEDLLRAVALCVEPLVTCVNNQTI